MKLTIGHISVCDKNGTLIESHEVWMPELETTTDSIEDSIAKGKSFLEKSSIGNHFMFLKDNGSVILIEKSALVIDLKLHYEQSTIDKRNKRRKR